jgi:hypothetical protein
LSLHADEVDRAWQKLGMVIKDTKDRHARFYFQGKLVVATKRSLGSGVLAGNVPHLIRQQLKLSAPEFKDLIDCPIGRNEYIDILKKKGLIPSEGGP